VENSAIVAAIDGEIERLQQVKGIARWPQWRSTRAAAGVVIHVRSLQGAEEALFERRGAWQNCRSTEAALGKAESCCEVVSIEYGGRGSPAMGSEDPTRRTFPASSHRDFSGCADGWQGAKEGGLQYQIPLLSARNLTTMSKLDCFCLWLLRPASSLRGTPCGLIGCGHCELNNVKSGYSSCSSCVDLNRRLPISRGVVNRLVHGSLLSAGRYQRLLGSERDEIRHPGNLSRKQFCHLLQQARSVGSRPI
jgi:hypothetical protein